MDNKKKAFLRLVKSAFFYAQDVHRCADGEVDKLSALSYAAACTAKSSAAEAIYWNTPELERNDISELLHQFDVYTDEVRECLESNHSLQWEDIHFNTLEEAFNASPCSQPIPE